MASTSPPSQRDTLAPVAGPGRPSTSGRRCSLPRDELLPRMHDVNIGREDIMHREYERGRDLFEAGGAKTVAYLVARARRAEAEADLWREALRRASEYVASNGIDDLSLRRMLDASAVDAASGRAREATRADYVAVLGELADEIVEVMVRRQRQ